LNSKLSEDYFPRPRSKQEAVEQLDETIKLLRLHAESLKPPAEAKSKCSTTDMVSKVAASVRDTAGAVREVREVAQSLLKTISSELHSKDTFNVESSTNIISSTEVKGDTSLKRFRVSKTDDALSSYRGKCRRESFESEDDSFPGEEEVSLGIDLPMGADTTSGNVTPIPTTGEMEELNTVDDTFKPEETFEKEPRPDSRVDSRATPLKSLLKKSSITCDESSSDSDSESEDGMLSPRKVHFSEIDEIKMMSQDSLVSRSTSDGSDIFIIPEKICQTFLTALQH